MPKHSPQRPHREIDQTPPPEPWPDLNGVRIPPAAATLINHALFLHLIRVGVEVIDDPDTVLEESNAKDEALSKLGDAFDAVWALAADAIRHSSGYDLLSV